MFKLADLTCEGYGTNYPVVGVAFTTPGGRDVSIDLNYLTGVFTYTLVEDSDEEIAFHGEVATEKLRRALALFIDTALRFGSADELVEDFQEYEASEIDNMVDDL